MRSLITLAVLVGLGVWLVAARPGIASNGSIGSIATHDDNPSDDCREHLQMNGDDYRATVRDEETRSIPNQPLTITGERNGGIWVTTWDQPNFSVKLCKQAAGESEEEARRMLAETKITVNGSSVSVSVPDSGGRHSLGTLLMVKAPRDASVNLTVHNGGVAVNRFAGTVEAHAQNGGIVFKNSSGKLTAEAQNGGISISECQGEIAANVQNGGLSISLPDHWEGRGLEAHTQNGGLVIAVPKNFGGGMEIVGSEYTAIVCRDSVCDGAERSSNNGHRMLRWGANPQIHASTVNGGIVVKEKGVTRREL